MENRWRRSNQARRTHTRPGKKQQKIGREENERRKKTRNIEYKENETQKTYRLHEAWKVSCLVYLVGSDARRVWPFPGNHQLKENEIEEEEEEEK